MFNPSRLVLARKRRRLTGRDLATEAGLTPVHISRIEQGRAENIERSTIEALASALSYPIDFFFGEDIDFPTKDSASFRSLTAMSAKERDAALSAGAIAFLLSDWVGKRFNLPELDLPNMRFETKPEAAAEALRSHWGLGEKPITNVIKLLESKGIRVFSLSEDTRNVDAFSVWREDTPYIFLNTYKTSERSRFDALHELGHLVLHRHGTSQGRHLEMEANKFASHFLMPSKDLLGNVPFVTSLNQLIKAKERWGVSVKALAYRLNKESRISDWQYRTFCIQINQRFSQSEPNGIARERSVVWEKIFRELWKDKETRDQVAEEICIPRNELDGLVFSLIDMPDKQDKQQPARPMLRVI